MSEVKRYHVTDTGLVEGQALGRINVVLGPDYDSAVQCFLTAAEGCVAAERRADALQALLTAADERADHWRSVASESTCRAAELNARADETDRVLRSSVPGDFKNATSAVGAVQNYIASLEREIETFPSVLFQDCDFNGKNRDGSPPFGFTGGFPNKIKSIRMVGWVCEGPIKTVEADYAFSFGDNYGPREHKE